VQLFGLHECCPLRYLYNMSSLLFLYVKWFLRLIDIGFTSENFKKTTAKLLTKSFQAFSETVCRIGNIREAAYAFLNLSSFPL